MIDGLSKIKNITKAIYQPVSWIRTIMYINQIVLDTNVLIAIYSEEGSGKTTFAKLLNDAADPQIQTHYIAANPIFDKDYFIGQVGYLLNGKVGGEFEHFVQWSNASKKHHLLIIDNAEYLTEPFLDIVLNSLKNQDAQGYFHVCLIANTTVLNVLNTLEKTYKEMIHTIEPGHLNEKETREYIEHRFGLKEEISEAQAKNLFQLTQGKIAQINNQADKLYNSARSSRGQESVKQTRKRYRHVSLVAGSAIAALTLAFTLKPADPVLTQSHNLIAEVSKEAVSTRVAQDNTREKSNIPTYTLAATKEFLQPAKSGQNESDSYNQNKNQYSDETTILNNKLVAIPKFSALKMIAVKSEPAVIKKSPQAVAKNHTSDLSAKKALQNKYTIQLIASTKLNDLERFVYRHHIEGKVQIHKSHWQKKEWYVLTMGAYNEHDAAKRIIGHLPEGLVKFKPWVRKVDELQSIG